MKKILPIVLTLLMITSLAFAIDTSGANAPEVYQGLYPIKYNQNGDVIFTNTSDSNWYNYSEGKWANAVTLDRAGQMNPSQATEANITGYYVWVPRYAYLIRTGYNSSETGRIDIRFLRGASNEDTSGKIYNSVGSLENTTYVGDRQMEYLVHSAFRFDEELSGIWVGKYEASKGIEREIEQVNTIPNAVLWNSIDIASSFDASRDMTSKAENYDKYNLYGLGEEVNTHLIKTTEYGAVVYLQNSIYGANEYYGVDNINSGKEYTVGYLDGTTNIGAIEIINDKYKDVYKDKNGEIVDVKGSAYLETSDGTTAWNGETITNIDSTNGVLVKENQYGVIANDGQGASDIGFRVVLSKGENKNEIRNIYSQNGSYWWHMENGDVWAMGNNSNGQLGLGDSKNVYIPGKLSVDGQGDKPFRIKDIKVVHYDNYTSVYYLADNGEVYASGYNGYGQLGMGNTTNVNIIKKIDALDGVKIKEIISVGTAWYFSTFYLSEEGYVYVSGGNKYGQFGNGNTSNVSKATKLASLNGIKVKQIKVNTGSPNANTYYLTEDGEVYVTGYNTYGQLGVGNTTDVTIATKIEALNNVRIKEVIPKITLAYYLTEDGEVYVSGINTSGQLGVGTTDNILIAKKIDALNNVKVKKIIVNTSFAYYLTEDGQVYVSGANTSGHLGVGHKNNVLIATKIDALNNVEVKEIILSSNDRFTYEYFAYYLTEKGNVYVSGDNYYGQLGVGHKNNVLTVTKIDALNNVKILEVREYRSSNLRFYNRAYYISDKEEVYASGYNGESEFLGIKDIECVITATKLEGINPDQIELSSKENIDTSIDIINFKYDDVKVKEIIRYLNSVHYLTEEGEVYVSGDNGAGELGIGDIKSIDKIKKVTALEGLKIKKIVTQYGNTWYLTENGEVYVTGENESGELGLGHQNKVTTPTKVIGLNGIKIVDIQKYLRSIFYISDDGKVFVSGKNDDGQLGLGHKNNVNLVVQNTFFNNKKVKEIVTKNGIWYLCENGELYVSGYNNYGNLGVGHKNDVISVTQILANEKVKEIVGWNYSVFLITEGGKVYATGSNEYGQLGLGNKTDVSKATKVTSLDGVEIEKIVIYGKGGWNCSTYFITKDGEVYVTGSNNSGRLGIGSTTTITTPTKVEALNGEKVKDVIFKIYGTYFLTEDGKVYACGDNSKGQLGIGSTTNATTATLISALDGIKIKEIVLDDSTFVHFLSDEGTVYVSGSSYYGQLGTGSTSDVTTAKKVSALSTIKIKEIISINSSVYYIGENGEAYVSGRNDYGQLAVGTLSKVTTAKQIPALKGIKIKKFVTDTDGWTNFYISEDGNVYVSGKNATGMLAQGHKNNLIVAEITKFEDESYKNIEDVKSIYGNEESTVIVDTKGNTYVIGDNTNNKLGITGKEKIDIATRINIRDIKDVGIGSNFSVFLKNDGTVVGYGDANKNGNGLTNISQIAVGDNHAVFLNKAGQIIAKGTNITGINNAYKIVAGANHTVVLKKDRTTKSFGQADSNLTNVIDVFAGKNMTVYVTNDNKIYMMEDNILRELPIKNIVYAELNAREPYFIDYDRNAIDENGNIIKIQGSSMVWTREVKGNLILTERNRIYNLEKLAEFVKKIEDVVVKIPAAIKGKAIDYKIYGNSVQESRPTASKPKPIYSVGDLVTEGENVGKYKIALRERGKNLINIEDTILDMGANDNYLEIPTGYILKDNTDYVLSFDYKISAGIYRIYPALLDPLDNCIYDIGYAGTANGRTTNLKISFSTDTGYEGTEFYLMIDGASKLTDTDTLTLSNVQLEIGTVQSEYQKYVEGGAIIDIYLDEPLRGIDGVGYDYIDYANQQVVRNIEVLDDSGTKKIANSYAMRETPIIQKINVPDLFIKGGGRTIYLDTVTPPSSIEVKYNSREI